MGFNLACLVPPKQEEFRTQIRKERWGRKWQPTPVFLPGKSHGLRSLVGYDFTREGEKSM